jgi:flagellar motor switch protein FliG
MYDKNLPLEQKETDILTQFIEKFSDQKPISAEYDKVFRENHKELLASQKDTTPEFEATFRKNLRKLLSTTI